MSMLQLTPAQVQMLARTEEALAGAGHGAKAAVVSEAAQYLGVSPKTVHRWLTDSRLRRSGRTQRVDAGARAVGEDELRTIAAALFGTFRKTGNRIMTFDAAVEMLRANGEIRTDLSASRIATVLYERGLHPTQLARPSPSVEQRSLHPNHVWQVDASVCTAYYLSNATGLTWMDERKFYKNKEQHLTRIQQERLIRYTVADHYSHSILTRYYLGSESTTNLAEFLIWAFASKGGEHVMHGVPTIVELDMGSANTSAPVLNMLERLQVRAIVHERHNSRANGSVEKAHHLVEMHFESALRFSRVKDLADLNHKALRWAHHYGATQVHTRYKGTRHSLYMTIGAEQLRLAPSVDLMRELVTTHPVERRVNNDLEITFAVPGHGTQTFDVRYVPGVMAGAKLLVVVNPLQLPGVLAGYADSESGEQCWMALAPIAYGADGRRADAPVKGEDLRQAHRGLLDHQRDAVMLHSYAANSAAAEGATTQERVAAATAAQEKGALVFGGRVDPFKPAAEAALPAYLPKRGTALGAEARHVEVTRLNVVEACKRIREGLHRIGLVEAYDAKTVFPWVTQRFGDAGMPEDQVDAFVAQVAASATRAEQPAPMPGGLRAVGGGQ